jgi:hypothetical protein
LHPQHVVEAGADDRISLLRRVDDTVRLDRRIASVGNSVPATTFLKPVGSAVTMDSPAGRQSRL